MLAACQEPVATPLPDEPSEEARRVAERVASLIERESIASLRRVPRSPEKEDRVAGAIDELERLLTRLHELRSDPAVASRLSTAAWQALSGAAESGRAHASALRAYQRELESPLLGMRQRGLHLGPDLRAHLGLEPGEGFLVADVVPGSPAQRWGLQAWDVVLSIDEVRVADLDLFWMRYEALAPGSVVPIEWIHRGETRRLEIEK